MADDVPCILAGNQHVDETRAHSDNDDDVNIIDGGGSDGREADSADTANLLANEQTAEVSGVVVRGRSSSRSRRRRHRRHRRRSHFPGS